MSHIVRSLEAEIREALDSKIVLLSGPRQCGKTALSRKLFSRFEYLNFDAENDRSILKEQSWRRDVDLVIFDEIHKQREWKRWLKGIYDTEGKRPRLMVTGSARMDTFRKTGDSLAGRHFLFRLHPFSVKEVMGTANKISAEQAVETMLKVGSFPEPFLDGREKFHLQWRKGHLDRILREDLLDLESVRNLKGIEILVQLLSERVGSPVSYSSLARDLLVSPNTVKAWIDLLERLFVVFVVRPWAKASAKSLQREPKVFMYDTGRVRAGEAARLENLVALHLLKEAQNLCDTGATEAELFYLRDREKREVDFAVTHDGKIHKIVEVKMSDENFSPSLSYFQEATNCKNAYQVVKTLKRPRQKAGMSLVSAPDFLAALEF